MLDLTEMFTTPTRSVTLLGQEVTIEYVTPLYIEGDKCEGGCWVSERLIRIDTALLTEPERLQRVLVHEQMHMMLGLSGLSDAIGDLKIEEAICCLMESWPC